MRFSRRTESKRAQIFGEESVLSRIAYQANVLLLDTGIEVLRVGVRQSGVGRFVQNALVDIGAKWDFEVVLTAPNLGPQTVSYTVSSSDQANVPIDTRFDPAGPSAGSAGWQGHDRPGGRGTDSRDHDRSRAPRRPDGHDHH